ncbi:MAG: spore coat protein [Bacillota bacterium]
MPYHHQISPVSMSIDCLNSTKYMILRDAQGMMETATPQLKQAFARMTQDHVTMADEWFRLMNSRGWYNVSQARPESVTALATQIQTVMMQTQAAPLQAGIQFQQSPGVTGQFR